MAPASVTSASQNVGGLASISPTVTSCCRTSTGLQHSGRQGSWKPSRRHRPARSPSLRPTRLARSCQMPESLHPRTLRVPSLPYLSWRLTLHRYEPNAELQQLCLTPKPIIASGHITDEQEWERTTVSLNHGGSRSKRFPWSGCNNATRTTATTSYVTWTCACQRSTA